MKDTKQLQTFAIILISICFHCLFVDETASQTGRRFPSETFIYKDEITGKTIKVLTNSTEYSDARIYQTHPQWTYDDQYIAFRSRRSGNSQLFFVNEKSGEIIQITEGEGNGDYNLSRKSNLLYFMRRSKSKPAQIIEINFESIIADSHKGKVKPHSAYERIVTEWPDSLSVSGGMALDSEENIIYIGVTPQYDTLKWENPIDDSNHRIKNRPGGIRTINIKTGEIKFAFNVDFTMGHVQANPFMTHEIVFCHETGGDSPQRMWFGDMKTNTYRPFYIESDYEWVTHETFADADHVYFNVLSHLEALRKKPSGIFSVNLRDGDVRVLGQVFTAESHPEYKDILENARSFWHCNGSPDGKWAAGDDFSGNISLINVKTGEISLLTTGHIMKPDHAHPSFSTDSKKILFQSGKLSKGERLAIMIMEVSEDANQS